MGFPNPKLRTTTPNRIGWRYSLLLAPRKFIRVVPGAARGSLDSALERGIDRLVTFMGVYFFVNSYCQG
jgi:hypothetical protein